MAYSKHFHEIRELLFVVEYLGEFGRVTRYIFLQKKPTSKARRRGIRRP